MVAAVTRPSSIAIHEQTVMWAIMAMEESAPRAAMNERPNVINFQFEWEVYKNPAGLYLFTGRATMELDRALYEGGAVKPWMAAKETSATPTAPIAAYFTN